MKQKLVSEVCNIIKELSNELMCQEENGDSQSLGTVVKKKGCTVLYCA